MKAESRKAWNSFCFLVGAGGTGKTTLTDLFVENAQGEEIGKIQEVARTVIQERNIHQADLANDGLFNDLQVRIARRQLIEERKQEITSSEHGALVISDRSVIDAVVYSIIREDSDLQTTFTKNSIFQRLCELVGDEVDGREVIHRYQSALIVLVHPFNDEDTVDDNVRLLMNSEECAKFTAVCQQILTLLDIPFIDLRETNKIVRLNLLQDAIRCKLNN